MLLPFQHIDGPLYPFPYELVEGHTDLPQLEDYNFIGTVNLHINELKKEIDIYLRKKSIYHPPIRKHVYSFLFIEGENTYWDSSGYESVSISENSSFVANAAQSVKEEDYSEEVLLKYALMLATKKGYIEGRTRTVHFEKDNRFYAIAIIDYYDGISMRDAEKLDFNFIDTPKEKNKIILKGTRANDFIFYAICNEKRRGPRGNLTGGKHLFLTEEEVIAFVDHLQQFLYKLPRESEYSWFEEQSYAHDGTVYETGRLIERTDAVILKVGDVSVEVPVENFVLVQVTPEDGIITGNLFQLGMGAQPHPLLYPADDPPLDGPLPPDELAEMGYIVTEEQLMRNPQDNPAKEAKVSAEELAWRQSLTLDEKILMSKERIVEWYEQWDGMVYVSFSGGKDSTVLLHLVRSLYPEVPAVFVDTGLEYPEIREFVHNTENVVILKPKMPFTQVIKKYGYPVVSKETAQKIEEARTTKSEKLRQKRLHGEGPKKHGAIPQKWLYLVDSDFKISSKCCDVMKKEPAGRYEKETGRKPFVGTMAADSRQRLMSYQRTGCNAFDVKRPMSRPISFWLEEDIWEYIKRFDVPYCPIYNMGYTRTGCMFCMFGVDQQPSPNKFELMKTTHPRLYDYCMDQLGCRAVLKEVGAPVGDETELQGQCEFDFDQTDGEIQEMDQDVMENMEGGLAEDKTLADIAAHHGVSIAAIIAQVHKGIEVEMEHTNDPKIAYQIALDHLWELPDYYDRLSHIEENSYRNPADEPEENPKSPYNLRWYIPVSKLWIELFEKYKEVFVGNKDAPYRFAHLGAEQSNHRRLIDVIEHTSYREAKNDPAYLARIVLDSTHATVALASFIPSAFEIQSKAIKSWSDETESGIYRNPPLPDDFGKLQYVVDQTKRLRKLVEQWLKIPSHQWRRNLRRQEELEAQYDAIIEDRERQSALLWPEYEDEPEENPKSPYNLRWYRPYAIRWATLLDDPMVQGMLTGYGAVEGFHSPLRRERRAARGLIAAVSQTTNIVRGEPANVAQDILASSLNTPDSIRQVIRFIDDEYADDLASLQAEGEPEFMRPEEWAPLPQEDMDHIVRIAALRHNLVRILEATERLQEQVRSWIGKPSRGERRWAKRRPEPFDYTYRLYLDVERKDGKSIENDIDDDTLIFAVRSIFLGSPFDVMTESYNDQSAEVGVRAYRRGEHQSNLPYWDISRAEADQVVGLLTRYVDENGQLTVDDFVITNVTLASAEEGREDLLPTITSVVQPNPFDEPEENPASMYNVRWYIPYAQRLPQLLEHDLIIGLVGSSITRGDVAPIWRTEGILKMPIHQIRQDPARFANGILQLTENIESLLQRVIQHLNEEYGDGLAALAEEELPSFMRDATIEPLSDEDRAELQEVLQLRKEMVGIIEATQRLRRIVGEWTRKPSHAQRQELSQQQRQRQERQEVLDRAPGAAFVYLSVVSVDESELDPDDVAHDFKEYVFVDYDVIVSARMMAGEDNTVEVYIAKYPADEDNIYDMDDVDSYEDFLDAENVERILARLAQFLNDNDELIVRDEYLVESVELENYRRGGHLIAWQWVRQLRNNPQEIFERVTGSILCNPSTAVSTNPQQGEEPMIPQVTPQDNPLPTSIAKPKGKSQKAVQKWIGEVIRFYLQKGFLLTEAQAIAYDLAYRLSSAYWKPPAANPGDESLLALATPPSLPSDNPLPTSIAKPKGKSKQAVQKWMSEVIRFYVHEGRPQAQAIAIAYSKARHLPDTYWKPPAVNPSDEGLLPSVGDGGDYCGLTPDERWDAICKMSDNMGIPAHQGTLYHAKLTREYGESRVKHIHQDYAPHIEIPVHIFYENSKPVALWVP